MEERKLEALEQKKRERNGDAREGKIRHKERKNEEDK